MSGRAPRRGGLLRFYPAPPPGVPAGAAAGLGLRPLLLGLDAALLGAATGFGLSARLGLVRRGSDQRAQPVQHGGAVALLGALGLGGDVNLPGGRQAPAR